jgi:hypothetical protein
MTTTAMTRPEYVTVVTNNSVGKMNPTGTVMLVPVRGPVGEVITRSQERGGPENYNWLIDSSGAVYELTGFEKACVDPNVFLVGMVDATTENQYQSLNWLLGQLIRKKGVNTFLGDEMGESFSWVLAGVH